MQEQTKKKLSRVLNVASKVLDVPILLASILIILGLCWILYNSIFASIDLIKNAVGMQAKLFFSGILIGIVYGCLDFVKGFINTFGKTYRHLFNKEKAEKEVQE